MLQKKHLLVNEKEMKGWLNFSKKYGHKGSTSNPKVMSRRLSAHDATPLQYCLQDHHHYFPILSRIQALDTKRTAQVKISGMILQGIMCDHTIFFLHEFGTQIILDPLVCCCFI